MSDEIKMSANQVTESIARLILHYLSGDSLSVDATKRNLESDLVRLVSNAQGEPVKPSKLEVGQYVHFSGEGRIWAIDEETGIITISEKSGIMMLIQKHFIDKVGEHE